MKKLVLLYLTFMTAIASWATEPTRNDLHKTLASPQATSNYSRNNKPKSLRSGALQTVMIGKAGNVLSVLDANCHQIDVDSTLNTVLFIHRSDTVTGYAAANVAQYRYDVSKDGGNNWNVNIGPLNPTADNITINGRYPEAVLRPEPANPTNPDSTYIVYNGSWHNGASPIAVWQGQYYGVGKIDGDTTTFTEHHEIVNNANVEISTSMIQSTPGHYWNLNLDYTQTSTSQDTIRGLIIEKGVWSDSAGEVIWSYQDVPIGSALIYNAGAVTGNNLGSPTISFDPTGKYGWIVLTGDLTNDNNFTTSPIYMQSSDSGQTWSTPQSLYLPTLPGMFPVPSNPAVATEGQTLVESAPVVVDSAGNPHIFTIVGLGDTTSNTYGFYPFQTLVLYDLYYNPTVASCSWQANFLAQVYGYNGVYTTDNTGDANRIQASRTKDGKKIFVFWTDTDSSVVAGLASGTGTTAPPTNPYPNLFGLGIDMSIRKITDIVDFTAGDPLFGGEIPALSLTTGSVGGALFPVVSPTVLNQSSGSYNIPVVLTNPDYLDATNKVSTKPADFYYCKNINFTQSQFVNRFDNAPPTLTLHGPDTAYVLLGQPYTPPNATAYDCVYGNITPVYSSTVPTNGNNNTDSTGSFVSTWVATNGAGNSTSVTQTVIVSGPPIARFFYHVITAPYRYGFTDSSLNFPTTRSWIWGDGTSNNLNQTHPTHVYSSLGQKCVILTVSNQYGSSSDTMCITVGADGINDLEVSNKINVYPNPSSGQVTLEMTDDIAKGATVSIYNLLGEQTNAPIEIKPNVTQATLNLSNLEPGAYLMKIETVSGTGIKQLIINK